MLTYTIQGSYCGTPEIIKPLKTTHSKHVLMGKLVDNGTCMYHKRTSSLQILGIKVVCGPIIPALTHNTSIYLMFVCCIQGSPAASEGVDSFEYGSMGIWAVNCYVTI